MPLPLRAPLSRAKALESARKSAPKTPEETEKFLKKTKKRLKAMRERVKVSWLEVLAVVFFIALPKDLIDVFELTIIGKLVTIVIGFITGFILFIWFQFRVQEPSLRIVVKIVIVLLVETLPIIALLPVMTFLVLNVKLKLLEKILGMFK
jgi:ABC-type amino acid transport system permease subunit